MGASRTPVPSPVHLQRAASRGGTVALGRPRPRLGLVFPQGADLPMTRGGIWRRFCASGPPPPSQHWCVSSVFVQVLHAHREGCRSECRAREWRHLVFGKLPGPSLCAAETETGGVERSPDS